MSVKMDYLEDDGGGLYVHVAFCRRKCIYCDFFSCGERIADWPRYTDALIKEFLHRKNELAWPLRTVYFGGGTPSLMPTAEFSRLCNHLRPYLADVVEFTIEVNPDDVDEKKLRLWKREGVTRLSLGIQTFNDESLCALGRRHDSCSAIRAFGMARRYFDNISVDLMFGLPGQTLDSWLRDLQIAVDLRPEHISAYSLMYEDGTALTVLRDRGCLNEASEVLTEKMFLSLIELLSKAGYDHYEISNFALPGYRSRHNSSYWLQKPYIGLGPSAHSYDGVASRKANRPNLRDYLDYWTPIGGCSSFMKNIPMDDEHLNFTELIEEYVLTRLRTREGIPLVDFSRRFGDAFLSELKKKGCSLSDKGLVAISASHICLTEKAYLLSDSVILELASLC